MTNQKGFVKILIILVVVAIIGGAGYYLVSKKGEAPATNSRSNPVSTRADNDGGLDVGVPSDNSNALKDTASPPSFSERKYSFETVEKGGYSDHNDRKNYVIEEASEWKNLWDIVHAKVMPKPALPDINFNNDMIIAVFQGSHNTGGYGIEIMEIVEKNDSLGVQIRETLPSPDSITTQVITQPFHIIKTKKTDKEVIFVDYK